MILPAWTALCTVSLAIEYASFTILVAFARRKTGIKPPAMSGAPELDRAIRVHLNTLEKLAFVLPLLWIAALTVGDVPAAAAGACWGVTRIAYAVGYLREPRLRTFGAVTGDLFEVTLASMALYGSVVAVMAG